MVWQLWKTFKEGLGLDLSPTSIKLVHITAHADQTNTFYNIETPISQNTSKLSTSAISHSLRQSLHQLKSSYRHAAIAISDTIGFSLTLKLKNDIDLKTSALLAAAPYLSVPLDTLYFDFQKIKETESNEDEKILGVFCRQNIIHRQQKIINASGLKIDTIEIVSHSLERSYRYLHDITKYPNCWACVFISHHTFTLLLWRKEWVLESISDTLQISESLEAITTQLYQHIMQVLSIHAPQTLKAFWVVGDHPFCHVIQSEIRSVLELFQHPKTIYRNPQHPTSDKSWSPFYIALGLALRQLQ